MSQVTACPSCGSRFRVTADQLLAADGAVRCGACLAVFDAREYMEAEGVADPAAEEAPDDAGDGAPAGTIPNLSEPADADTAAHTAADAAGADDDDWPGAATGGGVAGEEDGGSDGESDGERAGDVDRDIDGLIDDEADALIADVADAAREAADDDAAVDGSGDPAGGAAVAAPRRGRRSGDRPGAAWSGPDRRQGGDRRRTRRHRPVLHTADGEPVLGERDKAMLAAAGVRTDGPPRSRRGLWFSAVLVLATLLAAQVFLWGLGNRAAEEPARGWYAAACKVLGCRLPVRRDVTAIISESLVVREHPAIPGALAVDALLVNRAPFAQPFPLVELRFSTMQQRQVAGRWFRPEEYIAGGAGGIAADSLMPQGTPVRVSLEIADPGEEAVNYGMSFR